jgi:hypothetical protein
VKAKSKDGQAEGEATSPQRVQLPADFLKRDGQARQIDLLVVKLLAARGQLTPNPGAAQRRMRTDAERAEARDLVDRLWHALVRLDAASLAARRQVMVDALDTATSTATLTLNGRRTPVLVLGPGENTKAARPAAQARLFDARVEIARAMIRAKLPGARVDDDVLRDAVEVWRTKAKSKWSRVLALADQLEAGPEGRTDHAADPSDRPTRRAEILRQQLTRKGRRRSTLDDDF